MAYMCLGGFVVAVSVLLILSLSEGLHSLPIVLHDLSYRQRKGTRLDLCPLMANHH